jgi:hypothetical protein
MRWGQEENEVFLVIVGLFLILSAVGLYLLRNFFARAGESGWSHLRGNSRFKSFEFQRKLGLVAAGVVATAGVVLLLVAGYQIIVS